MAFPLVRRLGPLAVLLLLAAPLAAQVVPLDGQWLKLQFKAAGRSVNSDTLVLKKATMHTKAFLHLTLAPPDGSATGVTYDWELWTLHDDKVWSVSDSGTHTFVGIAGGDQIAVDIPLTLTLANGRFLDVRATVLFDLKVKKNNGLLKKAKVKTLGGETINGSANGTDQFVGDIVIKGQDIKEGKLPFDP